MNDWLIIANVYIAASWCTEDKGSRIWLVGTGIMFLVIGVIEFLVRN